MENSMEQYGGSWKIKNRVTTESSRPIWVQTQRKWKQDPEYRDLYVHAHYS